MGMLDKILKYATPVLLVLIFSSELIGILAPQGMSQEDHEYQVKIHDLEQDKEKLEHANKQIEDKLENFKNEILKNDSIVDGYDSSQLDSAFADYFKR